MRKEKKSNPDKFEGLNKYFEEADKKKSTLYHDKADKKKSTLYPDNRKDFYNEFEDFLLVKSDLILLIGIIVFFSLFIIGCLLAIPYFQAEHVYNTGIGCV